MPLSWGTPHSLNTASSYDLDQFTKWFELNGLDFEIVRQAGRWTVTCWTVDEKHFVASGVDINLGKALLQVYSQVSERRRSPAAQNGKTKKPQPEG
jgi:hypothetical protein